QACAVVAGSNRHSLGTWHGMDYGGWGGKSRPAHKRHHYSLALMQKSLFSQDLQEELGRVLVESDVTTSQSQFLTRAPALSSWLST
ncbi:hypothetical protein P7K49_034033, partial [Saguinus oedipus]